MTTQRPAHPVKPSAEELFYQARGITPQAERTAYLAEACGDNVELRAKVEALLRADADADSFLATRNKAQPDITFPLMPLIERAGQMIGRYKILQVIGEGGFGAVFMAQQDEPVRRRVALKIIKPGMDSRMVSARFEAERQALALMDHPHIARVFDGGVTDAALGARPYFVMEYVKGDPVTKFADAHKLSIVDRLALFTQVCDAVQHAHTKGIIHRDLKPTNVLVSMIDGRPFAKVIDFGIAKATGTPLTEKTLFTEHNQLIGTPEYMSPEQAEGSPDIDTRTDVYALGVLLYELLTGATPFDAARLRSAAFGEMQRIIKEEDPPAPSLRFSRELNTLAATAAARQAEPTNLRTQVKGELDWIVMKCLEKDRTRRYETANALALDVQRHLTGEPIQAAPPSSAYRLRKFIRRHRIPVAFGLTVVILLAASAIGMGFMAARVARQRDIASIHGAQAKTAVDILVTLTMLGGPDGKTDEEAMSVVLQQVDESFHDAPALEASVRFAIASACLTNIENRDPGLASEFLKRGIAQASKSGEIWAAIPDPDDREMLRSKHLLGALYGYQEDSSKSEPLLREVVQRATQLFGTTDPDTIGWTKSLAIDLRAQEKYDEAERLMCTALDGAVVRYGLDGPGVGSLRWNVMKIMQLAGRSGEAATLIRGWRDDLSRKLGPNHDATRHCEWLLSQVENNDGPRQGGPSRDRGQDGAETEQPTAPDASFPKSGAADDLLSRLAKAVRDGRAGGPGDIFDLVEQVAKRGDPRDIPVLVGLIESDNTYDTTYGIGYFALDANSGLREYVNVEYDPDHCGSWWRAWWEKNKPSLPEEVRNLPIPEFPKSTKYRPCVHQHDQWLGVVHQEPLDELLPRLVKQVREGDRDVSFTVDKLVTLNDPHAIPTLIGLIESDNTPETIYSIGHFALGRLTGVKYDEDHCGPWWHAWWDKNKGRFAEDVNGAEIPTFPKSKDYEPCRHQHDRWLGIVHQEPLDEILPRLVKEVREGGKGKSMDLADKIAELNDPHAIPTLIGLIESDNTPGTVYTLGHFALGRLTGVKYEEDHCGPWWHAWWDKNKGRFAEDVRNQEIPAFPKSRNYKPCKHQHDQWLGVVRQVPLEELLPKLKEQVAAKDKGRISKTAIKIGELGDARAIPDLVALIESDNTYDTIYGIGYFALGRMTGVEYSETHNGAWWRAWWEKNKDQIKTDPKAAPGPKRPINGPKTKPPAAPVAPGAAKAPAQPAADAPDQDIFIAGDKNKRYFLIGPTPDKPAPAAGATNVPAPALQPGKEADPAPDTKPVPAVANTRGKGEGGTGQANGGSPTKATTPPADGYHLLIVLPGGDGSAEFHPFVKNMFTNALPEGYVLAQAVAPKWSDDENRIVWPTKTLPDPAMKFSTEEFIEAIIADVKSRMKIDEKHITLLGWSSGGPACYTALCTPTVRATAAFIAMSVFKPETTPPLTEAKGKRVYIFHSPQDFINMNFPNAAKEKLQAAGATVELETYEGGHGWHGDVFGNIRRGIEWIEGAPEKPR